MAMKLIGRYKIKNINKKSSIPALKNAQIDDVIYFEMELAPSGRSRRGCYATDIYVQNERTLEHGTHTLNVLPKCLTGYEFEVVA